MQLLSRVDSASTACTDRAGRSIQLHGHNTLAHYDSAESSAFKGKETNALTVGVVNVLTETLRVLGVG